MGGDGLGGGDQLHHGLTRLIGGGEQSRRHTGQNGRSRGRRFVHVGHADALAENVGLHLPPQGAFRAAARHADLGDLHTGGADDLHRVPQREGDALHYGAAQRPQIALIAESEEYAAGVGVYIRGAFAAQIGQKDQTAAAGLLLGGIRSAGFASFGEKLRTLVVNSLLETNLGMPYVYCIFIAYTRRFTERLGRKEKTPSFADRIAENNRERVK